jgi:pre-mRNA cleavage complex 2 protein Pcf11
MATREYDDDAALFDTRASTSNGLSSSSVANKKGNDFVRAPTDPVLRNAPCPIDQEPFRSEWSEEVQDFIWKDAVLVGGRYYHASCFKEVTKAREKETGVRTPVVGGTGRTNTPDSVLGKRKAEEDANGIKARLKLESA